MTQRSFWPWERPPCRRMAALLFFFPFSIGIFHKVCYNKTDYCLYPEGDRRGIDWGEVAKEKGIVGGNDI